MYYTWKVTVNKLFKLWKKNLKATWIWLGILQVSEKAGKVTSTSAAVIFVLHIVI